MKRMDGAMHNKIEYLNVVSGIVDWGQVARCYGKNFESRGGKIFLDFEVSNFEFSEGSSNRPVRY